MTSVERGVEAGDLRRRRERLHRRYDPGEIVWLVERGERNEPLQLRDHGLVDQLRLHEVRAAMHDAMADRGDGKVVAGLPQPGENGAHRDLMVDAADRRVEREIAFFTRGRLDAALGRRADALDLPRSELFQLATVDQREGGEFERGRAGVESQYDFTQEGHSAALATVGSPPKARPSRR